MLLTAWIHGYIIVNNRTDIDFSHMRDVLGWSLCGIFRISCLWKEALFVENGSELTLYVQCISYGVNVADPHHRPDGTELKE